MRIVKSHTFAEFEDFEDYEYLATSDAHESQAREHLRQFFDEHREEVFFSRQIEVQKRGYIFSLDH
jgi:hypothetical protein